MDLVLVAGAESNGTRLLTRIFMANGYWGIDGHKQPDTWELPKDQSRCVVRRSVPHGDSWTDFLNQYTKAPVPCRVAVPIRNPYFAAQSAIKAGHVNNYPQAFEEQIKALQLIMESIPHTDLYTVTYESLIQDKAQALRHLGLSRINERLDNPNEKYYS